jgi:hypothetical protein
MRNLERFFLQKGEEGLSDLQMSFIEIKEEARKLREMRKIGK